MELKNNYTFVKLLRREFIRFFRNPTLVSVFFGAPILYGLLFGWVYQSGNVVKTPIILVDKDNTPLSNQLAEMLQESDGVHIIRRNNDNVHVQNEMIVSNAAALVEIPERFEANVLQKRYTEVNTYINMTNFVTGSAASKAIQKVLGTLSAGIQIKTLQRRGIPASAASTQFEPFKANFLTLFNTSGNYLLYMWPGLLSIVLQQVLLLAMAISFAGEYRNEHFTKKFLSRVRHPSGVILVKVIPFWILSVITIGAYYLLHQYFHVPIPQNISLFLCLLTVYIMSISFMGIFVSVILPSELKATQVLVIFSAPAFIIAGFTWPTMSMPSGIQMLANTLPSTPFLQALKILLLEKGSWQNVRPCMSHILVLLGIYAILSYVSLKVKVRIDKQRRWRRIKKMKKQAISLAK